ncbi:MAG TPA: TlpA disulfide reductase family protein [Gemmatimonadales bacterium]
MTARRQWGLVAGILATVVFGVALAIKIRPQIDLVGVGSRAPDFHAVDLATGRPVTIADYRGKVLLINIWATWCVPCRVEMPAIQQLHRMMPDTGFRILAVSVDKDPPARVTRFAQDLGLTFTILQDRPGTIQDTYQTTGIPESFVIDRNGVIVKKVVGPAEWDGPVNVTLIRRLLDAH